MALAKSKLKSDIEDLLNDIYENEGTTADFADKLSTAIEAYVKSGDVVVNIITTGNQFTQSGTVTTHVT